MDKTNPKFILRNYLMEEAIKDSEKEDFRRVDDLLRMALDPFDESSISDVSTMPPPEWAFDLCVSCSS